MGPPWKMAQMHVIGGVLQYSEPLYDQIEGYLLKLYAAIFVPTLEGVVEDADKRMAQEKARTAKIRELAKKVAQYPTHQGVQQLMQLLLPLAMAGVLKTDIKKLLQSLGTSKAKKSLAYLEEDMVRIEEAVEEKLGDEAKAIKADLERWREHLDPKVVKQLEELRKSGKKLEPLTIKLEPEHFPFLQGKFEDNVRKVRGEDVGMLDEMPQMQVMLAGLDPGAMGFWNSQKNQLIVGAPPIAPMDVVLPQLRQTVRHELQHVTQTVMARALGTVHLRNDEEGNPIPAYRAGPGMAPREAIDPVIHQAFRNFDGLEQRVQKLTGYEQKGTIKPGQKEELDTLRRQLEMRNQVMTSRGLKSPGSTYSLDDLEFYTHVADRISEFDERLRKLELTPEQKRLARDLWIGRKWMPKTKKEALAWIEQNDPTSSVWPHFTGASPFFRHLKKYQPKKYEKAVKEFVKATSSHFEAPAREGLEKLWEQFLEERYEGGKKKVPNPNSKTKDRYPDITVNYLMRQSDPGYGSARQKIRREFARWRHVQQMPPWMRGPHG
jgi:DNA-binding MarR family transcriptional regulator